MALSRRTLFVAIAFAAGAGVLLAVLPRKKLDLEECIRNLEDLKQRNLFSHGSWKPFQIFSHLAQSIEYSMSGYPRVKDPFIQNSVGRVAFSVFSIAGAMKHGLADPIPGAPDIIADGDPVAAIDRAIKALRDFAAFEGPLAPHFMYGDLSKLDYQNAHIMHVNNHMKEIQWA